MLTSSLPALLSAYIGCLDRGSAVADARSRQANVSLAKERGWPDLGFADELGQVLRHSQPSQQTRSCFQFNVWSEFRVGQTSGHEAGPASAGF